MVILEATAVGVAGYGLYKGGEAAVMKTNEVKKEWKRESKRQTHRNEFQSKQKERNERLARISNLRNNSNKNEAAGATTSNTSNNSWLPLSSNSSRVKTITSSTGSETKSGENLDDRYANFLKKLDASKELLKR